ncbi:DedA family protein [Prescottella agglutinans]|uniref:DedA family protein n=1 Tax=Prescottella agglutinans TaxID=1644129 RepID=A0A3S3BFA5_9NOCA|nr:DedA family protein [Prescottella agglutinans]
MQYGNPDAPPPPLVSARRAPRLSNLSAAAGTLVRVNVLAASESVTANLALLPGFLDPVNLLNSFGAWMLIGLLVVVFIESGLLFPLLPGDSLLFTAGLIAASKSAEVEPFAPLWVLMVTIPIAAVLGDQVGYLIGTKGGAALFKSDDAKLFKKSYIDESQAFFAKHGPITIFLARFVPIVRTYAPLVAGASKMKYSVFITYNVIGGIVWGAGVTLLGYFLGQIQFIADNIDLIFILIVLVSVIPIVVEVGKRYLASRKSGGTPVADNAERVTTPNDPTA